MEKKFTEIKVGSLFTFCQQTFVKTYLDRACDDEGIEHLFDHETLVEVVADPDGADGPASDPPVARLVPLLRMHD